MDQAVNECIGVCSGWHWCTCGPGHLFWHISAVTYCCRCSAFVQHMCWFGPRKLSTTVLCYHPWSNLGDTGKEGQRDRRDSHALYCLHGSLFLINLLESFTEYCFSSPYLRGGWVGIPLMFKLTWAEEKWDSRPLFLFELPWCIAEKFSSSQPSWLVKNR